MRFFIFITQLIELPRIWTELHIINKNYGLLVVYLDSVGLAIDLNDCLVD